MFVNNRQKRENRQRVIQANQNLQGFIRAYREIYKSYLNLFTNPVSSNLARQSAKAELNLASRQLLNRARSAFRSYPNILPISNIGIKNTLLKNWTPGLNSLPRALPRANWVIVQQHNKSVNLARSG